MSPAAPNIPSLTHTTRGAVYAFTERSGAVIVGAARSSVSAPGRAGIAHADGRSWMVPLRMLRAATPEEMTAHFRAAQAKAAALPTFKKGDVVEFENSKGKTMRGVVRKVGARISVDLPGLRCTMPADMARLVQVEPGDAGAMKGYTLEKYKEAGFMSEETVCFQAQVRFLGTLVADLQNEGHGGPTSIDPVGRGVGSVGFTEALKAAGAAAGNDLPEQVDSWVAWYISERALGVSFHDHLVAGKARLDAMFARSRAPRLTHSGDDISKIGLPE